MADEIEQARNERYADAVKAAREWRDAQRALPKPGDVIYIVWPGGPHDFTMEFLGLDELKPPPHEDYLWLHGIVGRRQLEHITITDVRTIYARPTSPGFFRMVGSPPRRPSGAHPGPGGSV